MSKIQLFLGCFLAVALLMAGCESYLQPGTVSGGFPGQATKAAEETPVICGTSPNVLCVNNSSPSTPQLPQITVVPTVQLSQPGQTGKTSQAADWSLYQDSVYAYQISYPPQFSIKEFEGAEMAKLDPQPVAGAKFSDPTKLIGGISASYFNLFIYQVGSGTSVEDWLKANGLYRPGEGWTIQPYKAAHFSGYQVHSSLYMAPGVFYYAVNGGYLYQLIPLGQDAEKMLTTFEFTQ